MLFQGLPIALYNTTQFIVAVDLVTKLTLLSQYKTKFQYSWQINHLQFYKPAGGHNDQPFSIPLPTNFALWSHFLDSVSAISGKTVHLAMNAPNVEGLILGALLMVTLPPDETVPSLTIFQVYAITCPGLIICQHFSRPDIIGRWSVASFSKLCNDAVACNQKYVALLNCSLLLTTDQHYVPATSSSKVQLVRCSLR